MNLLNKYVLIHQTDLYRPCDDPDDHWDLNCVYELGRLGNAKLALIVLDHPANKIQNREPDVLAIAQMNRIYGESVSVVIGTSQWLTPEYLPPRDLAAALAVNRVLRGSELPVVVNIAGSCRDIALAIEIDSDAFAQNCKAIYLNAGVGCADQRAVGVGLEYNIALNPAAYRRIFSAPCPVYWAPCFGSGFEPVVHSYGTWWDFRQGDILKLLSVELQRYYAYALAGRDDLHWLTFLEARPEIDDLAVQYEVRRNMWCSAGLFHAWGLTISNDGGIMSISECKNPVFAFEPVMVDCDPDGYTSWKPASPGESPTGHIFHVNDTDAYGPAMLRALTTLLTSAP